MKIVLAPDSFKSSLTAAEVSAILKEKALKVFPDCHILEIPLADGDKGTIDTLVSVLNGQYINVEANNYLGIPTSVKCGIIHEDTFVIEATELLLDKGDSDATLQSKLMLSSSYGVGQLILSGLDKGFRKFYIGAGASMANDGGMGCAQALGVKFYNEIGKEIDGAGISLQCISRIDDSSIDPRIQNSEITVMCSVNNVLTGDEGTTFVYGAQNGGGPDELLALEKGMRNYARLLEVMKGLTICDVVYTGACGGLPAALMAFCNAKLTSGISTILRLIHLEELLEGASFVVVGEGKLDSTTIYGKAIMGIGTLCKAKGIPVVAIVGTIG